MDAAHGTLDAVDGKSALRLWLRLLSCTALLEQQVRGRLRRQFNITLPQFDVLAELDRLHEPQTMTALSRHLMVSNGNLTGVVDRLERDRLVQRWPSRTDRRVQHIALTEHGRKLFRRVARAHEGWLQEALGDLPPQDVVVLSAMLGHAKQAIKNSIQKHQEETP